MNFKDFDKALDSTRLTPLQERGQSIPNHEYFRLTKHRNYRAALKRYSGGDEDLINGF